MSRPRGPRRLSAEEKALWLKVVERTAPMHPNRPLSPVAPPAGVAPAKPAPPAIAPFTLGQRATETRPVADSVAPASRRLAQQPLAMDHKAFQRMRRGKLPIEARIDLHGMTLDQAHPTLTAFILGAHAAGRRLVLVITGKGQSRRGSDSHGDRHGVLKRQVPQWLRMPPLSGLVLQIGEAHQSHGGSGAYYVYLRRHR